MKIIDFTKNHSLFFSLICNFPVFLEVFCSEKNTDYLYIIEGHIKFSGRIRHEYLFSLGKLEDLLSTASFRKLAKLALGVSEPQKGIDLSSITEVKVLHRGHCLIKKLWDKFDFDRFFNQSKSKVRFDIAKAVFYMKARHIILSDIKLGTHKGRLDFWVLKEN